MKKAVTKRDTAPLEGSPIPVLIECLPGTGVPLELGGRGRPPEGYVFDSEGLISVRTLSWDFARLLSGSLSKRWEKFCRAYGVSFRRRELVDLKSLVLLNQAVQEGKGLRFSAPGGAVRYSLVREGDQLRISHATPVHMEPIPLIKQYIKLRSALEGKAQEEIWKRLNPESGGSPISEMMGQVHKRISSGRLVLWLSIPDMKLKPGLYFSDIRDALYALFASQIAQPEGVGICERCEKVFKRSRVAQRFCSTKCGNYVRKKRQRAA